MSSSRNVGRQQARNILALGGPYATRYVESKDNYGTLISENHLQNIWMTFFKGTVLLLI
jgi:hypothetical protein